MAEQAVIVIPVRPPQTYEKKISKMSNRQLAGELKRQEKTHQVTPRPDKRGNSYGDRPALNLGGIFAVVLRTTLRSHMHGVHQSCK